MNVIYQQSMATGSFGNPENFAPAGVTLLDLIQKSRASEDGETTYRFPGSDKWMTVNTRKMERTFYILGSGFYEIEYLTRRAAARICREA